MLKNLSVPHFPQLVDGFCPPACAQMILAYWGIRRSQDRLATQLQTIPGAGTPGSRLRNLRTRTLDIHYGEGTPEDLRAALAQGIPPLALVNTKHFPHWEVETAHAVVIIAIDEAHMVINDPGVGHGGTIVTFADFLLAWDEMANLYALIHKS